MADQDGEAIRRLIRTPKEQPFPIPKDERVSITPESQFSRWYENSGGFDKAVRQAQLAQVERSMRDEEAGFPFKDWNPSSVKRPIQSSFGGTDYLGEYKSGSAYQPPAIILADDPQISHGGMQFRLDHELDHAVTVEDMNSRTNPELYAPLKGGEPIEGVHSRDSAYWRRPNEIDARLGTIKRAYAFNTGKLPETPEDSEKALQ